LKPPRLRGRALTAARAAAENGATAALLRDVLKKSLGMDKVASLPAQVRGELPLDAVPVRARPPRAMPPSDLPAPRAKGWPHASDAYRVSYESQKVSPDSVAERSLAAVKALAHNRVLNILAAEDPARTRREAAAATERYRDKRAIGPLDGVPFLLKDELHIGGLPTRIGSRCEPEEPREHDATIVRRLKNAGAVFIAKTVMTEWGMSPLGQNTHFKMPHNAHHAERLPGGSSTGSAVGVALGIAPFAIGTDGGGSIRVPAALNGLFGLKPTFYRVSRNGDGLLGSVGHIGPIASNATDLARFLDAVASEPDPHDPDTSAAAPPPAGGFGARIGAGVRGMRIGVPQAEWAEADETVARRGRDALAALQKEGAELVDVSIPLAAVAAPIGYITIGCESFAGQMDHWNERRDLIADDLRLSYAVLSGLAASEFLDAQRLRAALRLEVARVLRDVDVIALPTTMTPAPELPVADRGQAFADTAAIDAMCRFVFLGNLTGLPAGTAPVGVDQDGLPVGLQIVGDAWAEDVVIGVLAHLERMEVASVPRPKASYDLLG
jgi:aspartyl-tRNA(Asn)/glutamyl-tRNA(Gln) amidotransferase subunit A